MKQTKQLDNAFEMFANKNYKGASAAFATLCTKGLPVHVNRRLKQFKTISDRILTPNNEQAASDLSNLSALMNLEKFDEAEAMVGEIEMSESDASYLLAEIHLENDDKEKALEQLQKAIELDAANKGYALNSPVFMPHLNSDEFCFLKIKEDA